MTNKMITHLTIWTITLSVFWLLLSGFLQPLLLAFGVFSVALVIVLLQRMDNVDQQPVKPALGLPIWRYSLWLIGQVIGSSVNVAKLVWLGNKALTPAVEKLPLTDIPAKNRVLYANSITLTPGTLSIDIDDQHVTVHALEKASIEELKAGDMAHKIAAVFGGKAQ